MQIPSFAAHKCQLLNHISRQLVLYALLKRVSYLKCYTFKEICLISSETERGINCCFLSVQFLCKNYSKISFLQPHVLETFSSNEFFGFVVVVFFNKNIAPKECTKAWTSTELWSFRFLMDIITGFAAKAGTSYPLWLQPP